MKLQIKKEETRLLARKAAINFLILAVMALLNVFFTEVIWWNDISDVFAWMDNRTKVYLIDAGLVLLVELFLYFISGSAFFASLASGAGMLVLSIINHYKYTLKGDVFTLSDLRLAKEAMQVVSEFYISVPILMVLTLLLFGLCMFWIRKRSDAIKMKITMWVRICLTLCGCAGMIFYLNHMPAMLVEAGANTNMDNPDVYYLENGLIAGLVSTLPEEIEIPAPYDENVVDEITAPYEGRTSDETKPNIIFIMNESLYDIQKLESLQLSEDPLARLKSYQEQFIKGEVLSPSYGGNTCQVEYEVLTGYSSFNVSGIAYTDYVKEGVQSVVSVLKDNGYQTYAMHPYTRRFFNRDNVYTYMGFDRMLFEDDFTEELVHAGEWTTDASLYQNLITEYENRDKSKPFFAHVVTTQNHGGHNWEYTANGIYATSDAMEEKDKTCLETYANLLADSDKALEELLTYFQNTEEPTIIVFWGDHSPELGQYGINNVEKQQALAEFGHMEDGLSTEEASMQYYVDIHSTPLLIWNNYGLESEDLGQISAYRVGAYALSLAGIRSDAYFNMIAEDDFPNVVGGILVEDGTIKKQENAAETIKKQLDDMWTLQYDRMFGNQYSLHTEIGVTMRASYYD